MHSKNPASAALSGSTPPLIHWEEDGESRSAHWRSESGNPPPKRVVPGDDQMTADSAYRLACEGTAILWRGDFQNARQLLQAIARRIDNKPRKAKKAAKHADAPAPSPVDVFNLHRLAQSQRARTLAMILLPLDEQYAIPLRRAPVVRDACEEAYGAPDGSAVVSLREVLGLIGAHEWRKKGVEIPALGARIHPYYGVFSPVRGEYIQLVANQPLPSTQLAFDIGTGTGVLAALLAQRGVERVVATDIDARALACARENIARLALGKQVEVIEADLFPDGRAPLVVCNPPWLPARPNSAIEHAIYDPESRMLRGFLNGLAAHLTPGGEGWLILSDFAEHLGLRTRAQLQEWIDAAGLKVDGKLDVKPQHPRAADKTDALYAARSKEVTSLWRLVAR
ncbi:Protein-N(5)-glutamine methyltransferase PrmC, methylates polypeptide chain release factors RF1 and RF2 [Caballeronia glathei]|uniref:Methylase n=1 Tax=Caballeronia glathei TaxID=60547 RepID=A0A069PAR0_9BURK|nr:class I SAM-dependent methyltransferase [Caballeronia glathei]KDR37730.1 methylase [Caballeronia glathei]CDY78532.1 Protein-N(5)-glutamine methyltransferase PrmC, methylates polypeptide chain release factors RF1 and RF2 [Caballeronia glathei]